MNLKYATLTLLFVASVMAAQQLSSAAMAQALMAVDGEQLKETFKKFEKEQEDKQLRSALVEVAKNEKYRFKAVRCLEMSNDFYPDKKSNVRVLVHNTVYYISHATENDTEAFANVVASFDPSAVKPLASIRLWVLFRKDAKDVLKRIMKKSPTLIMDNLPKWLASHEFDRNSFCYRVYESSREQAFRYLVSLATGDDLSKALENVKNEHYKMDSRVMCCSSKDSCPTDLISQLKALLGLVQGRKKRLEDILTFRPTALIDLIDSYLTVDGLFAEIPSIKENTNGSQPKSCLVM